MNEQSQETSKNGQIISPQISAISKHHSYLDNQHTFNPWLAWQMIINITFSYKLNQDMRI